MKIEFHHLNICSRQVPEMDQFYRELLDLTPVENMHNNRVGLTEYAGETTYVTDGNVQIHLSENDHHVGIRTGQFVNPLDRGHIAFRTDDLDEFKRRLDEKGVKYSHYGPWAMGGWDQIFFFHPAGNVVEVHQVKSKG